MPTNLFAPFDLGPHVLKNRIVMAPMTRARRPDTVADGTTAEYYRQRAGAGLIITEGTCVSPEAQGYAFVPGIWNDEQVRGWAGVTRAVHEADGVIFVQLWHVGRVSHSSLQPDGGAPVSSTDRSPRGEGTMAFVVGADGTPEFAATTPPRALQTDELARVVADFGQAAANAAAAGFDGVEIHGANGYLFEQFLNPGLNDREDHYGGTIENRARLVLEVVDAALAAMGDGRVGVRFSPYGEVFDNPPYDETRETYLHLAAELAQRPLAYVHLGDQASGGIPFSAEFLHDFRTTLGKPVILAGGVTRDLAADYVDRGLIDLAAFGRPYIANPDLAERLAQGVELADPDPATFYGGGPEGYTDYPAVDVSV
ncbi:alkene reductase [Aeromicrobium sp. CFBP 8757]|uniref:alkene reductase n=1 Tax=Aeromicrobium sp. CFBP 8757 TaxID=2775288 RepID=UPI00178760EF|nr:alkene reductase [Aeromicrobium sp. CFBP 8757]MBD8605457.1 alkene reductase [Aeromicrobium sp. CFBP 8757]